MSFLPLPLTVSAPASTKKNGDFFICFDIRFYYIAWADLRPVILLPQLPKCWVYRCMLPCLDKVEVLTRDFRLLWRLMGCPY